MLPIVLAALLLTGQPCPLRVTLHDGAGAPLAATVQVRDDAGATLAEARTVGGVTELCSLPEAGVVRVVVAGQLATGVPLRQTGADATGVRVQLAAELVQLDLRVEDNGTVLPDPATMIVPEPIARSAPRSVPGATEEPAPTPGAIVLAVPSPATPANTPTPAALAGGPPPATAAAAPASTPLWVWLARLGLFGLVLLLWWYPTRRRR